MHKNSYLILTYEAVAHKIMGATWGSIHYHSSLRAHTGSPSFSLSFSRGTLAWLGSLT